MFPSKKIILAEYRRLDKLCGIDTSYITCDTYYAKENVVAYCQFITHTAIPARIFFNQRYVDWLPEVDCIDVMRHEYAHAAATLLYGPAALEGTGHGTPWKTVCAIVDCRPYPYTYNFNIAEPLAQHKGGQNMCLVECCRCGATSAQPKDSRIISVLRSGLMSWNFSCPSCGGFRFRMIEPIFGGGVS